MSRHHIVINAGFLCVVVFALAMAPRALSVDDELPTGRGSSATIGQTDAIDRPVHAAPPPLLDRFDRPVIDTLGLPIEYADDLQPPNTARLGAEESIPLSPADDVREPIETAHAGGTLPVRLEWTRASFGTGIGASGLNMVDLDGNGVQDIVAGASSGGFGANSYWYVLEHDAGAYAQTWVSPVYANSIASVTTADRYGPGTPHVFVGTGSQILVYSGATLLLVDTINTTAASVRGLTVVDVDSDGAREVVFCDADRLYVYDVESGTSEYTGNYGGVSLGVGNVDSDADLEIVIGNGANNGYVVNGRTHAVEWSNPSGFGSHTRVGDLDNDGKDEIVAGASWYKITAYDADLQSPKWEIPTDLDVDAVKLIDVEGNGSIEVVYGDGQWGSVYAHNGLTGDLMWSIRNPDHGVTDVAVGDTDGDGVPEIAWGAGYSSTGAGHLYVADTVTRTVEWTSKDFNGPFYALDHGDVDNDGVPELLVGSFESDSGYGDGLWFVYDAVSRALEYQSSGSTGLDWTGLWRIRHANIDADPQAEICITTSQTYTAMIICYDGITHEEQWRTSTEDGLSFRSLQVADVDSDGQLELVASPYREHTGAPGTYLYVYDAATGVEEWHSVDLGSYWASLAYLRIADVDADPNLEMLVAESGGQLFVYDGFTDVQQLQTADLDLTALDVADLDGNGKSEILVGNVAGTVKVLDPATGTTVRTIGNYGSTIDGMAVLDLNSDSIPDFALTINNELRIYDGAATMSLLWSSGNIGSSVGAYDSVTAGDFDGDGHVEIMVNIGTSGVRMYEVRTEVPDCNGNLVADDIDIANGTSLDCQPNGVPDECDIADATSEDANGNEYPDECEGDCNDNGIPDANDIAAGTSADCNGNDLPDECELDEDFDGVPGTCDNCPQIPNPDQSDFDIDGIGDICDPDIDGDTVPNAVDTCDFSPVGASVITDPTSSRYGSLLGDLDHDCDCDLTDLATLLRDFTGPGR